MRAIGSNAGDLGIHGVTNPTQKSTRKMRHGCESVSHRLFEQSKRDLLMSNPEGMYYQDLSVNKIFSLHTNT